MNILNICSNPDVLSSMRIVRIVMTIIRIVVPIILIISIMINYVSAVKDNDEEALNKANKAVVPKAIAALLVFFIPTFVNLIADIVDVNKNSYISCIKLATTKNINNALYQVALEKIKQAKKTLSDGDYNTAVSSINKIKDSSMKQKALSILSDVTKYMNLKNEILDLKKNYDRDKHLKVSEKVEKIEDKDKKAYFEKLMEGLGKGRPLNIKTGVTELKTYSGMNYYEYIPPHPTTNMALWIFLHGDGGIIKPQKPVYTTEEYFYLSPSPVNFHQDWYSSPIPQNLKKLIDHVVKEYEIDEDRIIISGFSRGAIGTWTMVNTYPNLFSVAFPISCRPMGARAKNFKTTVVRAHVGTLCDKRHGYECVYIDGMRSLVNSIKSAGGDATLTIHEGLGHGECNYVLREKQTVDFALSVVKKR